MSNELLTSHPPSIPHVFLAWCERTPDAPCLRFGGVWRSYAEMRDEASRAAGGLAAMGVGGGDRVALFLENSPEFLACYLGAHLAGATVVLVNPQYRATELLHILRDAEARVCVTDAARRGELARVERDLPALQTVVQADGAPRDAIAYAEMADRGTPVEHADAITGEQVALLAYTSGTTGRSKGAMILHRNLAANSAAVTSAWRWTAQDRLLLTLPLFHIHGLGVGINGTWFSGASVDLRRRFDAAEVYRALLDDPPTMFFGVPTIYTRLIAEAQRSERRPPPIRLYVSGSAPLSAQTFAAFEQHFGQPILERYGMTETLMNTTNPYDGERRPGTVGRPFPGQDARIVDARSRAPLPDGQIGEIQVRGPNVFAGYWRNPEATARAFEGGWFNTGDLGWRSADGYFTITGRAHELIISGGYNVYPREIEDVLLDHPHVAEAAVLGLPDADLGEQVVAALVPTPGAAPDPAEIVAFCQERLAAFKKPRRVVVLERLPRNAMGKVLKHELKGMIDPQSHE